MFFLPGSLVPYHLITQDLSSNTKPVLLLVNLKEGKESQYVKKITARVLLLVNLKEGKESQYVKKSLLAARLDTAPAGGQ